MAADRPEEQLDLLHRYILTLLGAKDLASVPEEVHLQKELWLLSQNIPRLAERCDFIPYLKGPYSETADHALIELRNLGFVTFSDYGKREIKLTPRGREIVARLREKMPAKARDLVEDAKDLLNDLTETELLVFTYFTYPEMTQWSVVLDKAVRNRLAVARKLYEREKVSLEKAASLAGIPLSEFRKLVGGALA